MPEWFRISGLKERDQTVAKHFVEIAWDPKETAIEPHNHPKSEGDRVGDRLDALFGIARHPVCAPGL